MKQYDIDKYLNNPDLIGEKIKEHITKGVVKTVDSPSEVEGHILKAQHNLDFVNQTNKSIFADWAITGCYYACYHAALALITKKGFSSKNHLATLLVLIKEFYNKGLDKEDIDNLSLVLDYQDILFYVESKQKREDASYSTKSNFATQDVEQIRLKSILFVSKVNELLRTA